jgi:hypothetical protein
VNVRRLNDHSLEHLIAVLRYSSLGGALFAVAALVGMWWWPAAVAGTYALLGGWAGWWYFGNSNWRGEGSGGLPRDVPGTGRQG